MNITLNNNEINKALVAYVASLGIKPHGDVAVNLVAGRGANGNTATITLGAEGYNPEDTAEEETSPEKGEDVAKDAPMFGD